ncbi:hypothetical protein GCM10022403_040920 [Streptomyces coacervatus]|uniref:Uncharacterized protein n=1 Tax=Streptomyces coacervatus TaxID=647381 RepID=A0ABP7HU05_9ACTN
MCTAWIVQSIQAGAPASRGEPETGAASYATPLNLSAPLTAKARHRASWWAPRTLTQKTPARAMRGQVVDVRPTMKATSGGSRDRDEKDWQAKPAGPASPSAAGAVTTVTPVAKFPSTRRNSAWSTGARSSSPTHRNSGRGSASTGAGVPADLR